MALIEQLFNKEGKKDSKHINNLSNKVVEQSKLNAIESGVTIEDLDSFNLPVCKYQTQITIHGLFNELSVNNIGNYKNLFQNKNMSIGVKWNAIDYAKKNDIYNYLYHSLDCGISKDSINWYAYKRSKTFTNKEDYKTELVALKEIAAKFDESLFFGGVYISLYSAYGYYYLELSICINAIYAANINEFILKATGQTVEQIKTSIEAKKEIERKEIEARKLESQKVFAAEQLIKKEILSTLNIPYTINTGKTIQNNDIVLSIGIDTDTRKVTYTYRQYRITGRQKNFRYFDCYCNELTDIDKLDFGSYGYETSSKTTKGGYLVHTEAKPIVNTVNIVSTKNIVTTAIKPSVQIINYSDKAIAVIGDTKPYKDKLKELGGRWNPNLNCGMGWIFSKNAESKVKALFA